MATSTSSAMLEQKSMDIVIVGGSLAALFAAVPLLRLPEKHRVMILERSGTPLLHDQGAGIVAGGETRMWFGGFDAFERDIGVTTHMRLYLDGAGNVVDQENYTQRMTSWDLLYHLARANFDGSRASHVRDDVWSKVMDSARGKELQEAWKRAKYEHGRAVESIKEVDEGRKVEVRWSDTREGSPKKGEEGVSIADFVVCADGPSSSMREWLLQSPAERKYVGYVAFRGTVPENELSAAAKAVFVEKFTFYHADGTQILAYTIPGADGSLEVGKRLVNWVWYWNFEEDSEDYRQLMTDSNGNSHRFTLPTGGKMQRVVWEKQVARAKEHVAPQFAEIVAKTEKPFAQAITDLEPPSREAKVGRLLNGKAALVGDALAGFRPHTAASTSQAAFDALLLEKAFKGDISWEEYNENIIRFAQARQSRGVMLGNRSQFGRHPLSGGGQSGQAVSRGELHMRQMAREE